MKLTHVNESGSARMVNIGKKPVLQREAVARGKIFLLPETLSLIEGNAIQKGDVLAVARIAGIQAAKKTAELIPLCHPLALSRLDVDFSLEGDGILVEATASCEGKTGVEMEALTAVAVSALSIYDMCKAVDKKMRIGGVELVSKSKK